MHDTNMHLVSIPLNMHEFIVDTHHACSKYCNKFCLNEKQPLHVYSVNCNIVWVGKFANFETSMD